jgi:hypothetical protein
MGAGLEKEGMGATWTGCIDEGNQGASCRLRAEELGAGRMRPTAEGGGSQGSSGEAAAGSSLSHGGATGRTWGSGGGG